MAFLFWTVRKIILIYGISMGVLIGLLKYFEYRFFVRDIPLEIYVGMIAVMFTALGAWAGLRLTRPKVVREIISSDEPFRIDETNLQVLGITKREYEVLELMSAGMSNQQIAERLFVSVSTVKTHVSSIFSKLDASRRTQAVQRAKELRIIS